MSDDDFPSNGPTKENGNPLKEYFKGILPFLLLILKEIKSNWPLYSIILFVCFIFPPQDYGSISTIIGILYILFNVKLITPIKSEIKEIKKDVENTNNEIKEIKKDVENTNNEIKEIKKDVENTNNEIKEIKKNVEDTNNEIKELKSSIDKKFEDVSIAIKEINNNDKFKNKTNSSDN